jgi:hypothetical protein
MDRKDSISVLNRHFAPTLVPEQVNVMIERFLEMNVAAR